MPGHGRDLTPRKPRGQERLLAPGPARSRLSQALMLLTNGEISYGKAAAAVGGAAKAMSQVHGLDEQAYVEKFVEKLWDIINEVPLTGVQ